MAIPTPPYQIINIDQPTFYSRERAYADYARSATIAFLHGCLGANNFNLDNPDPATLAATTPEGFPKQDFDRILKSGPGVSFEGTYLIEFEGQAASIGNPWFGSVQFLDVPGRPSRYDAATNTTQMLMVIPVGVDAVALSLGGTKRYPGDAPGTGIGRLRCMAPATPGGSDYLPTSTLFHPKFIQVVQEADGIRFMDWLGTNHRPSGDFVWEDRSKPTDQSQDRPKLGACLEHAIALCNLIEAHGWFCLPYNATPTCRRKYALALKNGIDESGQPYATPQANPFWKPLKPGLKIFLENSNEAWNGQFDAYGSYYANAVGVPAGTGLNYDDKDVYVRTRRYQVDETVDVSKTFREVFGSEFGTRLQIILGAQQSSPGTDASVRAMLGYLEAYHNNADGQHVEDPHPPNYYVHGLALGAYIYCVDETDDGSHTAEQVFASGLAPDNLAEMAAVCASYGVDLHIYEGAFAPNKPTFPPFYYQMTDPNDPRAAARTTTIINRALAAGVKSFCLYHTVRAIWRLFDDIFAPDTLKRAAWRAFLRRAGTVVPVPVAAPDFADASVPVVPAFGIDSASNHHAARYTFPAAGFLEAAVMGTKTATGGAIEVRIDGSSGGISAPWPDPNLTKLPKAYARVRVPVQPGPHWVGVNKVSGGTIDPNTPIRLRFVPKGEQRTVLLDDDFSGLADGAALDSAGDWTKATPDVKALVRDAAAGGLRMGGDGTNSSVTYNYKARPAANYRVMMTFKIGDDGPLRGVMLGSTPGTSDGKGTRLYFNKPYYGSEGAFTEIGAFINAAVVPGLVIGLGAEVVGDEIRYIINGFEVAYASGANALPAGGVPAFYMYAYTPINQTLLQRAAIWSVSLTDPPPPVVVDPPTDPTEPVVVTLSANTARRIAYVVSDALAGAEIRRAIEGGGTTPLSIRTTQALRSVFGPARPPSSGTYSSPTLPIIARKRLQSRFGDLRAGNEFADLIEALGEADSTNPVYLALRGFIG